MAPLVGDAAGAADVLVARATPGGAGALAIIRLSGPEGEALRVARRIVPGLPARPEARRALRATFLDEVGEVPHPPGHLTVDGFDTRAHPHPQHREHPARIGPHDQRRARVVLHGHHQAL